MGSTAKYLPIFLCVVSIAGVFGVASSIFRYQTAFKAMVVVATLTFGLFIAGQYARGESRISVATTRT
ncbi:hypothetical protein [Primorskyibacter sp. 2E233]|uniref:hypothetical protein n=1 Tax=Primorskyibacter sp. 2E233 TaxID=3413431 RepID=UPI003BF246EF